MTTNYKLRTVAMYICNKGFFLDLSVGSEVRTCVDDDSANAKGVWSDQEPSCARKSSYTFWFCYLYLVQSISDV